MTEENTEPLKAIIEEVTPIEQPVATKSRKVRSEMQLKALENSRQKAHKIRAEMAEIKAETQRQISKQVESKMSGEVDTESPNEPPIEIPEKLPKNLNENIKEDIAPPTVQEYVETYQERIEKQAETQQSDDHINNLIDERVNYKPIVKSKFKLVDGMYILRDEKHVM